MRIFYTLFAAQTMNLAWAFIISCLINIAAAAYVLIDQRRKRPRRIRIERGERLSEEEVLAALATGEKNRHWLAFFQLLDDYIEGADVNIGGEPGNATAIAWNAGGSEYLKNFRKHLLTKRAEAMRDFKADPGKLKRALTMKLPVTSDQ